MSEVSMLVESDTVVKANVVYLQNRTMKTVLQMVISITIIYYSVYHCCCVFLQMIVPVKLMRIMEVLCCQ